MVIRHHLNGSHSFFISANFVRWRSLLLLTTEMIPLSLSCIFLRNPRTIPRFRCIQSSFSPPCCVPLLFPLCLDRSQFLVTVQFIPTLFVADAYLQWRPEIQSLPLWRIFSLPHWLVLLFSPLLDLQPSFTPRKSWLLPFVVIHGLYLVMISYLLSVEITFVSFCLFLSSVLSCAQEVTLSGKPSITSLFAHEKGALLLSTPEHDRYLIGVAQVCNQFSHLMFIYRYWVMKLRSYSLSLYIGIMAWISTSVCSSMA